MAPVTSNPITSNTVLPADRRPITLHTTDGLALEGELALPADRVPVATLVCLHPLPTEGGSMDSHLLRKAAWRLPALAGIAVLRFNTRGTRGSQGRFDDGGDEKYDLAAALDFVEAEDLPAPWLLGWSFGSELVICYGHEDATVVGGILLSPPLHRAGARELAGWATDGKPLVAIVPELDDYLRPPEARERFAAVPNSRVVEVMGSKHLFVGAKYADQALAEIVRVVAPAALPLPQSWPPD